MNKTTKAQLESMVIILNENLVTRKINKVYEIGYRNGYTYLDQKAEQPHCITGNSLCGSKKEIGDYITAILKVLYWAKPFGAIG